MNTTRDGLAFYHWHYFSFPLLSILDMGFLSRCASGDYSSMDLMYLSELDPTWKKEKLAAITAPESALFANAPAVASCAADAAASQSGEPHDAKDFDDALSIRPAGKGLWEVGVHIADVSHYVKEGDIIDKEAEKRATSVYLVDRTIPMLPERLCNFICSLRPDEEKLAYSAIFTLNEKAEIKDWHLAHTVIRSNRRFTYEEVQHIFERNGVASAADLALPGEHPEPLPAGSEPEGEYATELITLNNLAKQLREKRFRNGAIGFDRAEVRFEIDEKGHPISTYIKVAKDANKLVEEFMLLANKSVAEKCIIKKPFGRFPRRSRFLPKRKA